MKNKCALSKTGKKKFIKDCSNLSRIARKLGYSANYLYKIFDKYTIRMELTKTIYQELRTVLDDNN